MKKKYKQQKGKGLIGDAFQGIYYGISNVIDPGKLKFGEIHQPIFTDKGLKFSQTSGPQTDILGRIKNKQLGQNEYDVKQSIVHDISYLKAKNQQDIRNADEHMLDSLKNKWSFNPLKMINNSIAYAGIKGKMLLEDVGISTYKPGLNEYEKMNQSEKNMVDKTLSEYQQQGYGPKYKKQKRKYKKKKQTK